MVKYTHTENENYMQPLSAIAVEAGFLQPNQRLSYEKGNSTYSLPTRIRLQQLQENGEWEYISRPLWVPEFSYKDGPSFVGRTISVMADMLFQVVRPKREAEAEQRRKRAALPISMQRK